MDTTKSSFPSAVLDYFGKRPGQTTVEIMEELKALTPEDRVELTNLLIAVGYVGLRTGRVA